MSSPVLKCVSVIHMFLVYFCNMTIIRKNPIAKTKTNFHTILFFFLQSLFGKKKHFVHFVLDPIGISDTAKASFAARYGCLVLIEKVSC